MRTMNTTRMYPAGVSYQRLLPALLAAVLSVSVLAQERTKDELLFMDVPVVVTASRREQPASETLVPVYVLSAEDIRMSGATSIVDALRMVPGIDVVTYSVRNQALALRGLVSSPYSSKFMVMVDGRSAYSDLYGTVLWETLPVLLSDIKRIEVVRTPGSSLYGSNAYSGIINIITYQPGEVDGLKIGLTAGEYNTIVGTAQYGRQGRNLEFALSGELNQTDEWRGRHDPAGELRRVSGQLRYMPHPDASVSLLAGRTRIDDMKFFADEAVGLFDISGTANYLMLQGAYRNMLLRTLYKIDDFRGMALRMDEAVQWLYTLFDVDLLHTFEPWSAVSVLWGINYRHNTVSPNEFLPELAQQHLFGLFIDSELKLGKRWRLGLGARYDHHPLSGHHVSPRGSVAFTPRAGHILRLSGGTAFRNPSFLDSYLDITFQADSLALGPVRIPVSVNVSGNTDLAAERLTASELSYHGRFGPGIQAGASAYYRYHEHLYHATMDTVIDAQGIQVIRSLGSRRSAHALGGELDAKVSVTRWLEVFGNYSGQYLFSNRNTDGERLEQLRVYENNPRHKCNVGGSARLGGLRLGGYLHWSQATEWTAYDRQLAPQRVTLPARLLVNGSIGYRLNNAELSIAVFNLFNREYFEYPEGINADAPNSDPLRQKVTATLRCDF